MSHRKIIHIDMDAFYASVEQRDNPELRGKPVAVGSASDRGVVAAASYEARRYGIHSAMPSRRAKLACRSLVIVPPRFAVYKAVSQKIRTIFNTYTELVEPLSLDEAYLDVTQNTQSATHIAESIRKKIFDELALTASAGVSFNKFLSKVASDINKPNGIKVIRPQHADAFVKQLKVEEFHGIGKVTALKMHKLGIFTGNDLRRFDQQELIRHFAKAGVWYYNICRCIDNRPVNPHQDIKSISAETTFEKDLRSLSDKLIELKRMLNKVLLRCGSVGKYGRTLTLKVRFSDFKTITRRRTLSNELKSPAQLLELSEHLLIAAQAESVPVRLLGIGVSNFSSRDQFTVQLTLDLH